MECPACTSRSFGRKMLEEDLQALECQSCGGYWINSFQYWLWRDKQPDTLPQKQAVSPLESADPDKHKVGTVA